MKLKYLFLEFLLIFLFLALPPLLAPVSQAVREAPRFGWASAQALVIAFLLNAQLKVQAGAHKEAKADGPAAAGERQAPHPGGRAAFQALATATVSFGTLMLIYAAVGLAGTALSQLLAPERMAAGGRPPEGVRQWLLAVAALAGGAFYEECLYRAFLPEIPLLILARTHLPFCSVHHKGLATATECACVLLFAFSHRYLGPAAVVNALLCGAVLRNCYKKSGGVLCGTAAHFCYNLTLLAFSAMASAA